MTLAGLFTLLKAAMVGILIGETCFLALAISRSLNRLVEAHELQISALFLCGFGALITCIYLFLRDFHVDFVKILRSRRADIFAMVVVGILLPVLFDGFGPEIFDDLIRRLNPTQVLFLVSLPVTVGMLSTLRAILLALDKDVDRGAPFFISDIEQQSMGDDLLDYSESATRFAERVLNGGSKESLVFGIDAPWGIGKSSYVNYCIEYWRGLNRDSVIVYKFDLLRYEDRANLVESFIDGLVRTLQKHRFVPEIKPLVSRYSRFMKGKASFSQFGLHLDIEPGAYTLDDAFDDLESALSNLNVTIIVVVDDLDRVSFATMKEILFAIKKSFTLSNISYVLCYDTENIVASKHEMVDADKVRDFLEKFVNVKVSLFLHGDTLAKYITQNFEKAVRNNLQLDPYTLDRVKAAVSAIEDIYKSPNFYLYQSFLGDVRKLKRLINTLVLFEIEKTDFENSDIDKHDLIHLLLIYINFPSIFRAIYSTETGGKRGFFSVLDPHDDGYPEDDVERGAGIRFRDKPYKNSKRYAEYVKELLPSARVLIDQVFEARTRLGDVVTANISEPDRRSFACFNGGVSGDGGRNLEEYLNLIVKLSKPQRRDQYRYYLNAFERLKGGLEVEEIFADEIFAFAQGESSRQSFWRVIVNSANELSVENADHLLQYLLEHIQDYSFLTHAKIGDGLRDDINYFVIKLLDSVSWSSSGRRGGSNLSENDREIASWVFGEGRRSGNGVLQILGDESRGALGLFDLMAFRLSCCVDRGGDHFNLQRALSLHGSVEAPTSGVLSAIVVEEMRELSQMVFARFKSQYIQTDRNLFEVIEQLALKDIAGKYESYVIEKVAIGHASEADVTKAIASAKSRLKGFITYQLANSVVSAGIGCGFYDEVGSADRHGIRAVMNDYLFDQCFAPRPGQRNYEHFLDYLLIHFASNFGSVEGLEYIPTIEEFTKILDRERLIAYWITNRTAIRELNLTEKNKVVVTMNYSAAYREDLVSVYEVLDNLVASIEPLLSSE